MQKKLFTCVIIKKRLVLIIMKIENVSQNVSFLGDKKGQNKKTRAPFIGGIVGGLIGSLHGIYKKQDLFIGDYFIKDTAKVTFEQNGIRQTGLVPEKQVGIRPAHKQIVCKATGNNKYEIINYWPKDADNNFKMLEIPLNPTKSSSIKGADPSFYLKDSKIRMNIKENGRFALFKKVLNPIDRKFFRLIEKLPFGEKITKTLKVKNSPLKTVNIGSQTFGYNKVTMLKGFGFCAILGIMAGSIIAIAQNLKGDKN